MLRFTALLFAVDAKGTQTRRSDQRIPGLKQGAVVNIVLDELLQCIYAASTWNRQFDEHVLRHARLPLSVFEWPP